VWDRTVVRWGRTGACPGGSAAACAGGTPRGGPPRRAGRSPPRVPGRGWRGGRATCAAPSLRRWWRGRSWAGLQHDVERRLLGPPAGGRDRLAVVVGADEVRLREGLRHQDRRRAVAAAHVRDGRAPLELLDDAVERGQPGGDQVRVVARPEEALAAVEDVVV